MKFLLAASSSGGHIYPAITFGNYLKSQGHEVVYIGIKNQLEEKIIKDDIILLDIKNSFKKELLSLEYMNFIKQIKKARKQIKDCSICVLFGGFISLCCYLIVRKNHIPVFLHEQNVIEGDCIKLLKNKAKMTFYAFPTGKLYIGNPNQDLVRVRPYRFNKRKKVLFMFGSLGSSSLNSRFDIDVISNKFKDDNFVFVNPKGKDKIINNVTITKNIDFRNEACNFDIVFIRTGATTLKEAIMTNAIIIGIPSPYVKHNHQYKNALFYQKMGLIDILEEKKFDNKNIIKIIEFYKNNPECGYSMIRKRISKRENNVCERMYKEIMSHV